MKYKITKSLNGEDVVFVARSGKSSRVIARASSEKKLEALLKGETSEAKEDVKLSEDVTEKNHGQESTKIFNPLRRREAKG